MIAPMQEDNLAGLTADLRLLGLRTGHALLDVGCGGGRHISAARGLGARAVGIDMTAQKWPRAVDGPDFVVGDGARLPFIDGAFDRVVCTEVLEHVDDPDACVRELARVLAAGGRAAVSVPTSFTEDLLWRFPGYAFTPGGHIRIFRTGELARLLRSHGFRLYDMRYRHSLASVYWLLRCIRGLDRPLEAGGASSGGRRRRPALSASPVVQQVERLSDYVWPKSLVLYARKG